MKITNILFVYKSFSFIEQKLSEVISQDSGGVNKIIGKVIL